MEQNHYHHHYDGPESARVRLTRFSSLDKVDHQPAAAAAATRQVSADMMRSDSQINAQEKSNGNKLFANFDQGKKWLWSRGEHLDELGPSKDDTTQVVLDPILLQEAASAQAIGNRQSKEPFQVVWDQLAFEVRTGTYDQLLGRALLRLRSLVVSRSPAASKQQDTHQDQPPMAGPNESQLLGDNNNRRVIFENLSGRIKSGEISAILGPSGVGKTSLINAICSKAKANYRGRVQLIGGATGSGRRMRVSVIPQKDYLLDRLTVGENLLFASRILNPDEGFDHEANILRLAKMLHLVNCLGSSTGSISGGEYKRVSIAQELLKRPDILILDEPTSGLDSVNCKNLIRSLRSLIDASRCGAINPIAIVLTIHQPDVEIFHMFDHIYCMARGGRTVYEGHPSRALQVIQSQWGLGEAHQFANVNPANLLIEIASEFVYGPEPIARLNRFQLKQFEHHQQSGQHLIGAKPPTHTLSHQGLADVGGSWPSMMNHLVGPLKKSTSSVLEAEPKQANPSASPSTCSVHSMLSSAPSSCSSNNSNTSCGPRTAAGKVFVRDKRLNSKVDHNGRFWRQMCLLTRRNFVADMRDPLMTGAAIVFHLMIPLVMWVAFSKKIGQAKACPMIHREMELLALASEETASKMATLQEEFTVALECSTMFFLASYCFSLRSLSMAALSFPLSMHVLVKESRNGWYRVPAYVLAKTISTLITEVLLPVVSLLMIYLMLEMPASAYQWRLWALALVMALVSLISTVQGLIWGALSMDSVQTAIFMGSASSLPLVLLSGFTARIKQMPPFMQYLSWISPYRYSSDAINIIRFGFGLCPCDAPMDNYLKTRAASFADMPERMKPLFTFYLTNSANNDGTDADATEVLANATAATSVEEATKHIAGISYDLVLNSTVRKQMLQRLESNELDLFGRMAQLLSRSFTYGRQIDGCDSVRSQLLSIGGIPKDDYLPAYFAGLAVMFVLLNVILFLVVRSKSKQVTPTIN